MSLGWLASLLAMTRGAVDEKETSDESMDRRDVWMRFCGGSGDCDSDCQAPNVEFCGGFGYFDDPGLRCAFCAPEDFQP